MSTWQVLLGMPCTAKADIYSFGVVLHELTTGEMPNGRNLRPIMYAYSPTLSCLASPAVLRALVQA